MARFLFALSSFVFSGSCAPGAPVKKCEGQEKQEKQKGGKKDLGKLTKGLEKSTGFL